MLNKIVSGTDLYAVQKKPERLLVFTAVDFKQYIVIISYMSLVNMPNIRSYWRQKPKFLPIKSVMFTNAFEKICLFIHFNNNQEFIAPDQPGNDRLYKISH